LLLVGAALFAGSGSMLSDIDTLGGFEDHLLRVCVLGAVVSLGMFMTLIVAPMLWRGLAAVAGATRAKRIIGVAVLFALWLVYLGVCAAQGDVLGSSADDGVMTGLNGVDLR
jgi:hypothetical protein